MNDELKQNIIKCSRCGLCMDVCPVYKVKKTETSVSRGKFLQILGLIKKDLKFDKKIAYNLDLCLSCKKCKTACPSNIDAVKIFSEIKSDFLSPRGKFLNSKFVFKIKMLGLKIFYKLKYPMGRAIQTNKQNFSSNENEKIAHFDGCASRAINSGFEIPFFFKREKFDCCGLPFYTKGAIDLYDKLRRQNIEKIKKYDKVVFDCATCYETVLNYEGLSVSEKSKLVYFTDFYKNKKLFSKQKLKVTFHKPCHLSDEKFFEIEEILKNIENVEYFKMPKYDDCCGFGGDFFLRHINTASKLSAEKIANVLKTNADVVLTTCPTCLWSLKYGIKLCAESRIAAYDLAHFLSSLKIAA